jgi:hypothetical protein
MVPGLFGGQRHAAHEAKGFGKILELEHMTDGVRRLVIDPAIEAAQARLALFCLQLFDHIAPANRSNHPAMANLAKRRFHGAGLTPQQGLGRRLVETKAGACWAACWRLPSGVAHIAWRGAHLLVKRLFTFQRGSLPQPDVTAARARRS